jgi:hypothetical protein
MIELTKLLEETVGKHKPVEKPESPNGWRDNAMYLRDENECSQMPRGNATFSPAWHEQARVGICDTLAK